MKQLRYKVIPNDRQRYPTVGDYWKTTLQNLRDRRIGTIPGTGSSVDRFDLIDSDEFKFVQDESSYEVRVSDMGNDDYHFLVLIHELIELHLVNKRGILIEDIDAFDKKFEEDRSKGIHSQDEEPGDSCYAPYRKEHLFATNIERLLAYELGVDWEEYGKTVMNL
jgi:hypothetical protein